MFTSNIFDAFQFLNARNNPLHLRKVIPQNAPPLIPPPPAAEEMFDEPLPTSHVNPQSIIHQKKNPQMMDIHFAPPTSLEPLIPLCFQDFNKGIAVERDFLNVEAVIQSQCDISANFEEAKKEMEEEEEASLRLSKTSKRIQKIKLPKLNRKIVKNFGKAIASFACSDKALNIIEKSNVYEYSSRKQFITFVYENKECIEGNRRFKQLLTIDDEDNPQTKENKRLFKKMAEIFMKSYVHQWIWNSKLLNKDLHAQLVGEMKKRIRSPSLLESLSNE